MTIRQYRSFFIERLEPIYGYSESESFFYLIMDRKYNLRRHHIALEPAQAFSDIQIEELNRLLHNLEQQVPVQYLLGATTFSGLEFKVTPDVLIPRPETEELVDWIIADSANLNSGMKVLDIGTGSGCIAVSIAKLLPAAKVSAIDISEGALTVARENAESNSVLVNYSLVDILDSPEMSDKFDIIVSNPPYVRNLEKVEIQNNVLDYEPHLALFVDDKDPLQFYRAICKFALSHLNQGGSLYFEINQYLGPEMNELLIAYGFTDIELRQDIFGNDRMIKGIIRSEELQ